MISSFSSLQKTFDKVHFGGYWGLASSHWLTLSYNSTDRLKTTTVFSEAEGMETEQKEVRGNRNWLLNIKLIEKFQR